MRIEFSRAWVRAPGPRFAHGLSSRSGPPPSLARARAQHAAYCAALTSAGLTVAHLPPADEFPDATFVEDAAVLGPGFALLTRPGAPSRRGEVEMLRPALAFAFPGYGEIAPPGTLEGGDVLACDGRWFIGLSERTNRAGAEQLAACLRPTGATATLIDLPPPLLHLKSAVSYLGEGRLLLAPPLVGHPAWRGMRQLRLPAVAAAAANCLALNGKLLLAAGFPAAAALLARAGRDLIPLDVSAFARMDGGLSCLSLRC